MGQYCNADKWAGFYVQLVWNSNGDLHDFGQYSIRAAYGCHLYCRRSGFSNSKLRCHNPDKFTYAYSYINFNRNRDSHNNCNSHANCDAFAYSHCVIHCDTYGHNYCNGNTIAYINGYKCVNGNINFNFHVNINAFVKRHAYSHAVCFAFINVYADTHFNNNADRDDNNYFRNYNRDLDCVVYAKLNAFRDGDSN